MPILLALSLNAIRSKGYMKSVQLMTYMPNFISTVVMVGILKQLLHPRMGLLATFAGLLGLHGLVHDALGLGGMGGQHRLNLQFVQATTDLIRRDTGPLKLLKKVAQRHGGRLSILQVADPGALLTQVDDLEEQAQRMGDLIGLADTKPMNELALGPIADAVVATASRGRELPNPVQVLKQDLAGLLPDDGIQPARQALDLFRYDYTQSDLT